MKKLIGLFTFLSIIGCISEETGSASLTDITIDYTLTYEGLDSMEVLIVTSSDDSVSSVFKVKNVSDTSFIMEDVPLKADDTFAVYYTYYSKGDVIATTNIENIDAGVNVSVAGADGTNGTSGNNAQNCVVEEMQDSIRVTCGKTEAILLRGEKGQDGVDGENCSGLLIAEGVEVSCGNVVLDTLTDGVDGSSCSGIIISEGVELSCGGVALDTLTDGVDGASCTGNVIAEGFEISCDGTPLDTIIDGVDGASGIDGTNGTNGTNGTDGADGTSCTAIPRSEGLEVSCGGVVLDTITNGIDGTNGTNGINGENGDDCSGVVRAEGLEISCGGTILDTIIDGTDGNDCNGTPIAEGTQIICGGIVVDTVFDGSQGVKGDVGSLEEHIRYTQDTLFTEFTQVDADASQGTLGFKVDKLGQLQFFGEFTLDRALNTATNISVFSFSTDYIPAEKVEVPIVVKQTTNERYTAIGIINTSGELRIATTTAITTGATYYLGAIDYQL